MIPEMLTEIQRLKAENHELASRPCLACDIIHPARFEAMGEELDSVWSLLHRAMTCIDSMTIGVEARPRTQLEIDKIREEIRNMEGHIE